MLSANMLLNDSMTACLDSWNSGSSVYVFLTVFRLAGVSFGPKMENYLSDLIDTICFKPRTDTASLSIESVSSLLRRVWTRAKILPSQAKYPEANSAKRIFIERVRLSCDRVVF